MKTIIEFHASEEAKILSSSYKQSIVNTSPDNNNGTGDHNGRGNADGGNTTLNSTQGNAQGDLVPIDYELPKIPENPTIGKRLLDISKKYGLSSLFDASFIKGLYQIMASDLQEAQNLRAQTLLVINKKLLQKLKSLEAQANKELTKKMDEHKEVHDTILKNQTDFSNGEYKKESVKMKGIIDHECYEKGMD